MGGYRSGRRRWRNRGTVEATRSLDLNQLNRAGCLEPGWQGRVPFTISGKVLDSADVHVGFDHVSLSFQTCDARGRHHKTRQIIRMAHVRCRFGGSRKFFRCPGVVDGVACGRRVLKLYWPDGGYILCRHCHRLTFASQSEDQWDRAYRRAGKLKERLGGEVGLFDRPQRMHRRTFEKLRNEFFEAERKSEEKLAMFEARLLARLGSKNKPAICK